MFTPQCQAVRFRLIVLLFSAFASLTTTVYFITGGPTIYWHAANDGLPSDVQSLAIAPPPSGTPGLSPTLYAGNWGGGVYRSTDHGATWVTATAGLTLPMYVRGGLAVNPVTPTVLFAGDYFGGLSGVGVYRSTDGGVSWTVSLPDADIEAVLVLPLTPTLVLAGDREDGLYRSIDSGDSWGPVSVPMTRVQALAAAPSPPGRIYAGADYDLYVSADGGITWTLASTLSSTIQSLAVHPTTTTSLYAGTRRHGLWRSSDAGISWVTQTIGLPSNAWVTSIALDPITPSILYAGVWSGQVYRSGDGGDSWEGLGYLGTVEAVLVHPTVPSVVYAGTSNNGVFRGSTLDHLTMDPIDSPQYVNHAFPITVTARDALGFPLSGGFNDTASLTDTTGTISPTLIAFADGIATTDVVIATPVNAGTIVVTLPGGPIVTSNPFNVVTWPGEFKLYLPVVVKSN